MRALAFRLSVRRKGEACGLGVWCVIAVQEMLAPGPRLFGAECESPADLSSANVTPLLPPRGYHLTCILHWFGLLFGGFFFPIGDLWQVGHPGMCLGVLVCKREWW